jgi:hypothetical protein
VTASEPAATTLKELLRRELAYMPIEAWGDFFPAWVALWRFLAESRPGTLDDEVRASYQTEPGMCPHFRGRGAEWFMQTVMDDETVLGGIERVMYEIVDSSKDVLPGKDFLRLEEVPEPSEETCERIGIAGLSLLDRAVAAGSFKP